MLAHLVSATIAGLDAVRVDVEVDLAPGLPSWAIVGLPEASVREAKERVRAAITNLS
ncbi:MAG: ATP-binding protein, partial [Zetaproteobacteria bacterium]